MADDPVVVVGAGVAGLLAARSLVDAGHSVVVVDGDTVAGGRLATRLIGGARLDHGAQFMTARSPDFAELTQTWLAEGTVYEWCRGFDQPPAEPDGHPRYAATGGMAELANGLAEGLVVQLGSPVIAVDRDAALVGLGDGSTMVAAAVVLTPPVPHSLALLDAADAALPAEARNALEAVTYEPTLVALAVLDQPSEVPPPGGVQLTDGPFTFVADNHAKGISELPAVTLHASGPVSRSRWDQPDPEVLAGLMRDGRRWLGSEPTLAGLQRWWHARPVVLHPERYLMVDGPMPLVWAGDAFGEARVEGAILSGWAAAAALAQRLA